MSDAAPRPSSGTGAVLGGVSFGVVFAVTTTWYASTLGYPLLGVDRPEVALSVCVLIVSSAVPAYAFLRRRVVSPFFVLGLATYTWLSAEGNTGPGDPFVGFLFLLPLWTALMILVGIGELRVRAATT